MDIYFLWSNQNTGKVLSTCLANTKSAYPSLIQDSALPSLTYTKKHMMAQYMYTHQPARNISVPGLTTAGISPQDCLSLYSTCVPSSLNDLLVNKKLKDLSLLVHSHTLSSTLGDLTHLLTYMHAHTSISYRRITTQCTWFNNHWCSTTKLSWSHPGHKFLCYFVTS